MTTSDATVSFMPWIGPRYTCEGLEGTRLLVVGHSHYGNENATDHAFTRKTIRSLVYGGRYAFHTKVAKLIVGRGSGDHIFQSEREWVFDRIAFYNYIQSLAGTGPDGTVTDEMWAQSRRPFLDVVTGLAPDAILVLGKETGKRLPSPENFPSLDGTQRLEKTKTTTIRHPSRGFSYDPWMEKTRRLIGGHPSPKPREGPR